MSIDHMLVGSPIPWVSMPGHGVFAFGHGTCQTCALVIMLACISIVYYKDTFLLSNPLHSVLPSYAHISLIG